MKRYRSLAGDFDTTGTLSVMYKGMGYPPGWFAAQSDAELREHGFEAYEAPDPVVPARELRRRAYLMELALVPSGDPLDAIGDTMDALIRELQVRGAAVTPEFQTVLDKVTAIKARYPK